MDTPLSIFVLMSFNVLSNCHLQFTHSGKLPVFQTSASAFASINLLKEKFDKCLGPNLPHSGSTYCKFELLRDLKVSKMRPFYCRFLVLGATLSL